MAEHAYGEEIRPENWTADMFQVLISQLSCAYERKQKTPDQCWKILHDFYMQTHEGMNQEEIDVISYYATSLDALIQYLDEADMPRAEKQRYFRIYQDEIHDFITHYSKRNADAPELLVGYHDLFARDSGVRYSPDLVRFLRESPALVKQLQVIAGEKRLEIYYQTYQKYFM